MSGASQVNKGDPRDREAIDAYLANGGTVQTVSMGRHGTCERRRGIQFGNGNARKAVSSEDATQLDQRREEQRRQTGTPDSEMPF